MATLSPEPVIQASPAPPGAQAWHDYLRRQKEESPQRLEEAAKFLSGMIAVTLGIVAASLEKMMAINASLTKYCMVTWLLSLVLAFLVVFPFYYRFVTESAASIEAMHKKSVQRKYWLLVGSTILFLAALIMLVLVFTGQAPPVPKAIPAV